MAGPARVAAETRQRPVPRSQAADDAAEVEDARRRAASGKILDPSGGRHLPEWQTARRGVFDIAATTALGQVDPLAYERFYQHTGRYPLTVGPLADGDAKGLDGHRKAVADELAAGLVVQYQDWLLSNPKPINWTPKRPPPAEYRSAGWTAPSGTTHRTTGGYGVTHFPPPAPPAPSTDPLAGLTPWAKRIRQVHLAIIEGKHDPLDRPAERIQREPKRFRKVDPNTVEPVADPLDPDAEKALIAVLKRHPELRDYQDELADLNRASDIETRAAELVALIQEETQT